MSRKPDYSSTDGAETLAYIIRNYWKDRGVNVKTCIAAAEKYEKAGRMPTYGVRSSLKFTVPPSQPKVDYLNLFALG